jgi:hypothetical protein
MFSNRAKNFQAEFFQLGHPLIIANSSTPSISPSASEPFRCALRAPTH